MSTLAFRLRELAYAPLHTDEGEIRLLIVEPARSRDYAIICRLKICSLLLARAKFMDDYAALSYTWGTIPAAPSIIIDGVSVPVTPNLFAAIKHLRSKESPLILWIDALCINQRDVAERNSQVTVMRAIYGRASMVHVWLGDKFDGSTTAASIIKILGGNRDIHFKRPLEAGPNARGKWIETEEYWEHIVQIFTLPWWTRAWTVQEYVHGRYKGRVLFHLGPFSFEAELLNEFLRNCAHHNNSCCGDSIHETNRYRSILLDKCWPSFQLLDRTPASGDILLQLARFRTRDATNPRDKLYGMLGLSNDGFFWQGGAQIDFIDYDKSIETAYEKFATHVSVGSRNLDILSHLYGERKLRLPSWVPDWTATISNHPERYVNRLNNLHRYNASAGLEPDGIVLMGAGRYYAKGFLFDVIDEVLPPLLNTQSYADIRAAVGLYPPDMNNSTRYPPTEQTMETALYHTLAGGIEFDIDEEHHFFPRRLPPFSETSLSKYGKWITYFASSPPDDLAFWNRDVECVWSAISSNVYDRAFIKTRSGCIGFAPLDSKKGDSIAILAGGSVPYILVPKNDSESDAAGDGSGTASKNEFTIRGDCYIHGIMDGEVGDMLEEAKAPLQMIVLV
ncbi:heterokaryon incompatibility protein-domain-containing protein [Leptodontidium sp. 2 PMI_412]|nr:heterokaryon incompatibility protein-domain-containing protein [Leptodontidium sp. 2 PMI_412]